MLLGLAARNVLRNRRRSAITVLSIAAGLAAMTFMWGFIDGQNRQMIENSTRYFAGHLQVHLKGYHDDPALDLAIADSGPLIRMVRGDPAVAAASVRLEGKALASNGDKSRGILLAGIAPGDEDRVSVLPKALVEGESLAPGAPGVLVGEKLAQALGVRAGGELVFIGQAYDGSVASGRHPVRGIFRTGIDELDGYLAVATLASVRDFFAAPEGATAAVVRLGDRRTLEAARARLAAALGERFEVLTWPVLLPMVAVSTRFHDVVGYVVLFVFLGVVGAAVANPVLMAVLERTREFGVLLALGTRPGQLLGLVLIETMLLGAAGVVAGNALGIGITAYFHDAGVDLGSFGPGLRVMPGLEDVIYPEVNAARSLALSAIVFVIACLSAVYPAAQAAGLKPVSAIRGLVRAQGALRGSEALERRWPVFLLIAARSLLRNPRRTGITAAGAALCIAAFVFLFGFFGGFFQQAVENATRYLTGHMQLARPGFRTDLAPELALEDVQSLLATVRAVPGVQAATPRVQAQALASTAAKSEGIMLIGIDPVAERAVTFVHQVIVEGQALEAGAARDILVGRRLAAKLRARLGDKVVLMAQAADGELATGAFRIRGIFATESSTFDGAMAFVTLPAAQSLLALGTRISTVNLRLAEHARPGETRAALERAAPGLEVAPWQELLPQVAEMVRLSRVIGNIMLAMVFLVVATAIMNTVFMVVAERTREFGVMMALGTAPGAIQRMVLYETAALLVLASLAGYGTAIGLVAYYGSAGIDLSGFFGDYPAIPGLTGFVYPRLIARDIVPPGIALMAAALAVSFYPAWKASRLDPVAAIRHV